MKTLIKDFVQISACLTPLTPIVTLLDSLIDGDYGPFSEPTLGVLKSIKRNADRLLEQINSLLDFAAIEALKAVETNNINSIITDIKMPEVDGYELTQSIRSHRQYANIPEILLTAKSDTIDKVKGLENGVNDCLGVGSKITWRSVGKMSSLLGTFADSLCRVIFVRSLTKPFSLEELIARIKSQLKFALLQKEKFETNPKLKKNQNIITENTRRKLESVKKFLEDNYFDFDITRESLADSFCMSPDHLGRMYKEFNGERISDYLNRLRIEAASKKLLETDDKIVDIAFDVGFGSLRSFNNVFRNSKDVSPSKYRECSSSNKKYSRN